MKKSGVIGMVLICGGTMIFALSMMFLRWDFTKLSTRPAYEEQNDEFSGKISSVNLTDMNMPVVIGKSSDDKIRFTYYEREGDTYEINTADNKITINKTSIRKWYEYISFFDIGSASFTILLPESYKGELNIKTSNARINASNLNLKQAVFTSSNGSIKLDEISADNINAQTSSSPITAKGVEASGEIILSTSNGYIKLDEITANGLRAQTSSSRISANSVKAATNAEFITTNGSVTLDALNAQDISATSSSGRISAKNIEQAKTIELSTTNGSIKFDLLSAKESITLSTKNSSIDGTLAGKMSDYYITSGTTNSKSSLPELMPDGNIKLSAYTSNGRIAIDFEN